MPLNVAVGLLLVGGVAFGPNRRREQGQAVRTLHVVHATGRRSAGAHFAGGRFPDPT